MTLGIARNKHKVLLSQQIQKHVEAYLAAGGKITVYTSEDNAALRFEKDKYNRQDFDRAATKARFDEGEPSPYSSKRH